MKGDSLCRELPKKPTKIKFTKDGQSILVSDKFGDLFRYARLLYVFQSFNNIF